MEDGGAEYQRRAEDQIAVAVEQATGLSLARDIAEWTEGTRDPDYEALLAPFGVNCARRPDVDAAHFALLGMKTANSNRECKMAHVFDGSPAQAAGLSANDVLVALGGLRTTPANLDTLLSRYATGDVVELVAFRRDELMRFRGQAGNAASAQVLLEVDQKSARAAQQLRQAGLARSCDLRGRAELAPVDRSAAVLLQKSIRCARSVRIRQTESADGALTMATDDLLAVSDAARQARLPALAPTLPTA